ncbi:MAG: restriction endonuclease subunit S [Pedobacter sp.]
MTIETFFANFDHFVDAPNGVQKLRELILHLAVRGKLVPQHPDDAAATISQRLESSKELLSNSRTNAKATSLPSVTDDESYPIPTNWTWVRLGQIVEVLDSLRKPVTKHARKPGPYPYYGASGIVDYVSEFIFDEPLVLVGEDGAKWDQGENTAFLISGKTWVNNHAHVLRPIRAVVDDQFLVYVLVGSDLQQYITGITVPKLNQAKLVSIAIPLPPIEEQKRIVAKVDQLMALCSDLEARQQKQQQGRMRLNNAALDSLLNASEAEEFADHWQRICNNFDLLYDHPETIAKLRAVILQLAVQGKLVPQDPNDEPASVLLERIKAEKERLFREKVIRKGKISIEVTSTEVEPPHTQPDGWERCRLEDISLTLITGPFGSSLHKSDYVQNGIPVINPASLRDGKITPLSNMAVGEETIDRLSSFMLQRMDIVLARRGEMGRCALVTENEEGWLCGTGSVILRLSKMIFNPYFVKLISSDAVRHYLSESSVGSTMSNLNQKILMNMAILLPPEAEQKRIVAKVDQLMALCDELEAKLEKARQHSETLMEATVQLCLWERDSSKTHVPHPTLKTAEPKPAPKVRKQARVKVEPAQSFVAEPQQSTYGGNIPQIILDCMDSGHEYSRTEIITATRVSSADWTWAIRQLKELGKVRQIGERRGARYRRI